MGPSDKKSVKVSDTQVTIKACGPLVYGRYVYLSHVCKCHITMTTGYLRYHLTSERFLGEGGLRNFTPKKDRHRLVYMIFAVCIFMMF